MALSVKVGSFAAPNATGHQSYTGIGFQPKAVIFFGNSQQADGTGGGGSSDASMPVTFGFGAGSANGVMVDDDDFTSGDPVVRSDALIINEYGNGGSNTIRAAADMVSCDADGFTLNWSVATSGFNPVVNYLALGGSSLQAAITSPAVPAGTGSWAITGAGFQPDAAIILLGSDGGSGSPEDAGIGFISAGSAGTISSSYAPSTAGQYIRTNQAIAVISGATKKFEAALTSLDSGGMTLNVTTRGTFATAPDCSVLWLKGVQIRSDAEVQKTSTGTQAYTGYGFTPKALLVAGVLKTAGTTIASGGVNWMFGATDGTNRAAVMKLSNNFGNHALDRTKMYKVTSDAGTGAVVAAGDLSSFDADGFTLNYSTADATARQFLTLAFGDPAGGGTGWTQTVNDSVTMSDAQALGRGLAIADSATLADALAKDQGLTLSDSVTMADAVSRGFGITVSDSVTMADALSVGYGLGLSDSVTMSDALAIGYGLGMNDAVTMADALAFGYGLALADSATMSDSISPVLGTGGTNWTQNIDDTLSVADAVALGYGLGLSDAATMSDAVKFDRGLALSDTAALADAVSLGYGLGLTDNVTLADALSFARGLSLNEIVSVADSVAFDRALSIDDAVTLSDALSMLFNGQPLTGAQAAHVRSYFVTKFGFYT